MSACHADRARALSMVAYWGGQVCNHQQRLANTYLDPPTKRQVEQWEQVAEKKLLEASLALAALADCSD